MLKTSGFKKAGFIAVGALVVAALWLLYRPQAPEAPAPVPEKAVAVPEKAFDLVVKGGKLVSGEGLMQVHRGERVSLRIQSDSKDELHLHGYDLKAPILPGETAHLQFTADRTGRFGLELHKAHGELGTLEVYPQ
jgi:hypothetical protein